MAKKEGKRVDPRHGEEFSISVSGDANKLIAAHDPDDDILAFWMAHAECIMWPSAPKTRQAFLARLDISKTLRMLCVNETYKSMWRHVLLYTIEQMWFAEMYSTDRGVRVIRGPGRGRPKHDHSSDFYLDPELRLCVFSFAVSGVVGRSGGARHWQVALDLLREIFPEKVDAAWRPGNLRGRVNMYLRNHRESVCKGFEQIGVAATHYVASPPNDLRRCLGQGYRFRRPISPLG